MRLSEDNKDKISIVLSRRNILSLLAKLDGHPKDSALTIFKIDDNSGKIFEISAEENYIHYGTRAYPPGNMHSDTERQITKYEPF